MGPRVGREPLPPQRRALDSLGNRAQKCKRFRGFSSRGAAEPVLSLFKRHRELLLVTTLLVYPFVTFLSQGGRGRDPNVVDRVILGITAPIQRWLLGGGEAVAEGVRSYVALRGVREENLALADEAARLRNEMNDLTELRAENQRLKQAMGYADATPESEVLARVVGFSPAPSPKAVRLDRGISAGVRAGMAVVSSEGVVGQVIRATDSSADVALVTDPQTRVGVRVQRSRARATVAGAGANRPLRLENALRTDDIQEDDVLVTSGADGVFPVGLLVGRVRDLSRTNHGVFQIADIHPSVDLGKLEEVLVVTSPVQRILEPVVLPESEDPGQVSRPEVRAR